MPEMNGIEAAAAIFQFLIKQIDDNKLTPDEFIIMISTFRGWARE